MEQTEEKDFQEKLKEKIETELRKEYMAGVRTGWVGCLLSLKEKTKDLHNAKKIRAVINEMIAEYYQREDETKENKSEPTP